MSKIRDAMRKAEQEHRGIAPLPGPSPQEPRGPSPQEASRDGLPSLSPEALGHYESIGKQIEVVLGDKTGRTLIFAAAVRGDGISTVISQYAAMLSRRGGRVLLIDGNPRHPSLHRFFGIAESPGLAEFVAGQAPREAVLHATGFQRLSVVPLGRCSDRSQAERITEVLGEFAGDLVGSYEYVLVDTDFIGSPFFSQSAVQAADGVVLVVRAGRTNRAIAGRACDTVRRAGGEILGVVLNRRRFPIPDFIYRRL